MKSVSRFERQAGVVLMLFTAWMIAAMGCTTFHGPGTLQAPGDYQEAGDEMPTASESWKGERQESVSNEDIAFDWPVDDAKLSQPYQLGKRRPHWGIDLANKRGTPILSAEKGYVIYTGRGFRGYGNLIVVEHSPEWATLYSHLDKIEVSEGQYVKRGTRIGTMGRTGRASGVHLHFEIRHNRQPVNPQAYLPPGL